MIRAVFFDIDGTLVSLKTKRCPDSTKAAIRALREKGIRVYVASGRSRFELEEPEMLRGMTFDGYLIFSNSIIDCRSIISTNTTIDINILWHRYCTLSTK